MICAAIKSVCSEYRIHNADVYMKEDCDVDDLVDCIEGSRIYIPCIYVINKIDQVHLLLPIAVAQCLAFTVFCTMSLLSRLYHTTDLRVLWHLRHQQD